MISDVQNKCTYFKCVCNYKALCEKDVHCYHFGVSWGSEWTLFHFNKAFGFYFLFWWNFSTFLINFCSPVASVWDTPNLQGGRQNKWNIKTRNLRLWSFLCFFVLNVIYLQNITIKSKWSKPSWLKIPKLFKKLKKRHCFDVILTSLLCKK